MKIRNKFKKILALTLALSMSVGMLHIPTETNLVNAAETTATEIGIQGLRLNSNEPHYWPKKNGYWNIWQIYLNTDADLPDGKEFKVKLRDNTTETTAEFRKSSTNIAYMKIEGSFLPENATKTFTIKEGTYTSTDGSSSIKIKNDYSIHVEGGVWTPVGKTNSLAVEKYVKLDIGTAWDNSQTGGVGQIYLHRTEDDGIAVSEEWINRLEPVCADVENGIFYGSAAWFADTSDGKAESRNSSYKTAVRLVKFSNTNDKGYSYAVVLSDYGISATENDLVRFGGYWKDTSTGKIYKFAPMTFKFNGTTWEDVTDSDGDAYSGSLRVKDSAYDKGWVTGKDVVNTNLYLKGVDSLGAGITADEWSSTWLFDVANSEGTVKIDGTQVTDIEFRKYNGNGNYYYLNKLPNVNKDSVVTIEGKFKFSGGTVTFDKREYKWDGTKWIDIIPNTGKLTTSGAETDSKNATGNIYFKGTDNYLVDRTYDDWNVPGTRLVASDENSGVFVGDTKVSATLIKYSGKKNWYYLECASADTSKVLTVKGTFMTSEGVPVLNIEDSKFHWDGTKWVDGGLTTDITINGFNSSIIGNKWYYPTDTNNGWRVYFGTSELPGTGNENYKLTFSNGTKESEVTLNRNATNNEIYGYIPKDLVDVNKKHTLTLKADKYYAYKDGKKLDYGINIKNDVNIYISEYGWSFSSSEIKPDKKISRSFVLNENSSNANAETRAYGFYLTLSEDDGVSVAAKDWDGWADNNRIMAMNSNSTTYYSAGIFKNGENLGQANTGFNKLSNDTYYISVHNAGGDPTAVGDTYVIKGLFKNPADGSTIEYRPLTVKWTENGWEQLYTELANTGVKYDVNSDKEVDVRDLVALKIYLNDNMYSINKTQADIDGSGSINVDDADRLRMYLAGAWNVDADGTISGIPTYNTERTFNKAAYGSVKIGTWDTTNSKMTSYLTDAEVDTAMQKYKAAGLNLLLNEGVAGHVIDATKNDGIKNYLEAAERNGLGVIVASEWLYGMAIHGPETYADKYTTEVWQTVIDDLVSELRGYSATAFKGLMIADEIEQAYLDNYKTVANYIATKYPELIIHASQMPASSTKFTSNDKEKEYKYYVNTLIQGNNMFAFDMYPLKMTIKKTTIGNTIQTLNYDFTNWFNTHKWIADVCKTNKYSFNKGVTIQSCKEIYSETSSWSTTTTTLGYAPTFNEDIGFQVFTSMAYGVKEINFWTYDGHHNNTAITESIANNEQVYNAVKTINGQIDKFANVYLAYDWRDTFDIASGASYTGSETATDSGRLQSASANGARTLIGHMKDVEGFDGYMIANAADPRSNATTASTNATTVTLNFKDATKAVVYDYQAGTRKVVDLTNGALTVSVNVGEGTFVIPVK